MDSIRQNKVARLIQRDLSEMFQQECKEYTEGAMLSVTAVRVSPDLSYAKIYVSIVPELRFFVDDSLDYIDKIDELLK